MLIAALIALFAINTTSPTDTPLPQETPTTALTETATGFTKSITNTDQTRKVCK
jgi:hypothetical protein